MFRGTTILSVRRGNKVVIGGDGQVTLGNTVMKGNARKVRRLYHDKVIAGFAGATADAFTLFEHFESKLEKHRGNLTRAAVEPDMPKLPIRFNNIRFYKIVCRDSNITTKKTNVEL